MNDDDERNLRFENAMATLAEIAAQLNERLTATKRSNQTLIELTASHAEPTADQRRRVARLEEAYVTLDELLRSHIERLKRRPRRR